VLSGNPPTGAASPDGIGTAAAGDVAAGAAAAVAGLAVVLGA